MTEGYELAYVIGGLVLSLCAFSLIFGDNYLFRLGASILSGAVSAYICVLLAEHYFYPLILDLVDNRANLPVFRIVRALLVFLGILLLFGKAYTGSKTGGRIVMTVLMSIAAVLLVMGSAGGTVFAYIRTLAGQFRTAVLSPDERGNIWYWIKAGTVLVSAVAALLFTRHYGLARYDKTEKSSESVFGSMIIGFTFGAIAAAVFLTAANILVNHISGLSSTILTLGK